MGFFDKLFSGSSEGEESSKSLPWIHLTDEEQLYEIAVRSEERPQVIFKHSTSCGISSMVLNMFTRAYTLNLDQVDLYFLDIHQNRSLSNNIASTFEVRHESPQLIILENKKAIFDTSHGAIADFDLANFLSIKNPD